MKRRRFFIIGACVLVILAAATTFWILNEMKQAPTPPSGPSQPQKPIESALACTEALPLNTQIGQKLMAAGYSDQLADEQAVFAQANIGGVIVMDQIPVDTITAFRTAQLITPLIAVDQEGGTVQRYQTEGTLPGATDMATDFTSDQAYQQYLQDDTYLKSIGITTNFAPVVDVLDQTPSPLPGRMYSADPAIVVSYASANIKAAKTAGITPVIKHFPGLGSASGNTDDGSATTDPLATLETRDILPYQQLVQFKPDAMVSNAVVPGLTDGQPAVWSTAAVSLLRSYGYQDSVIYSDSLTAKAIPGQLDAAVVKAWQAGIDVALIVQKHEETAELSGDFAAIQATAMSALQSGDLKNSDFSQSVLRILQRKGVDPCQLH